MLELRPASVADGLEVWKMLHEIGPGENGFGNDGAAVPLSKFGEYLQTRVDMEAGLGLPSGHVPFTTFWLLDGERPLGISKLRHYLTPNLKKQGGHIGYCIRPSARGMGYGRELLRLTLKAARDRSIAEVLVTINRGNLASCRVAAANGGILRNTENGVCYYIIPT